MDRLALGFVFVAGDAGGRISLGIEWNRMLCCRSLSGKHEYDHKTAQGNKLGSCLCTRFGFQLLHSRLRGEVCTLLALIRGLQIF
jgi:hypothetical protein